MEAINTGHHIAGKTVLDFAMTTAMCWVDGYGGNSTVSFLRFRFSD